MTEQDEVRHTPYDTLFLVPETVAENVLPRWRANVQYQIWHMIRGGGYHLYI